MKGAVSPLRANTTKCARGRVHLSMGSSREPGRRLSAWRLLRQCTGGFGSSRSLYMSPTDSRRHQTKLADLSKLTCRWTALGRSRPWTNRTIRKGRFDSSERQDRVNVVPSNLQAQLLPLFIINQITDSFRPAFHNGLNNWGPRVGTRPYTVDDKTGSAAIRRLLRQPESERTQFSRLVPPFYGRTRCSRRKTDLRMK